MLHHESISIFFLFCVALVNAQFSVVRIIPNGTISSIPISFLLEIDRPVNQPNFTSFITIHSVTKNQSIVRFDVHSNQTNITYSNQTISFFLSDSIISNLTDETAVLMDAGVLFSNNTLNSSAISNTTFWRFKLNISMDTTTGMNALASSSGNAVETTHSDVTGLKETTLFVTSDPMINGTTTPVSKPVTGEPPPTRSAQWGMALGIIIILVIVVGEILYFKYFYVNHGRSSNYYS